MRRKKSLDCNCADRLTANDDGNRLAGSEILALAITRRYIGSGRIGLDFDLQILQIDDPIAANAGSGI
jgi:hypothetical protein